MGTLQTARCTQESQFVPPALDFMHCLLIISFQIDWNSRGRRGKIA